MKHLYKCLSIVLFFLVFTPLAKGDKIIDNISNKEFSYSDVLSFSEDSFIKRTDNIIISETTVFNEPFSIVTYSFSNDIDQETIICGSQDEDIEINSLLTEFLLAVYRDEDISNSAKYDKNVDHAIASKALSQACVEITSDAKYSTAIETYDNIEELLIEKYGITRYTSRRGHIIAFTYGKGAPNEDANSRVDVYSYAYPILIGNMKGRQLDQCSQRIIKLKTERYLIIDHYIQINESESTFSHRLVFSIIPIDPSTMVK